MLGLMQDWPLFIVATVSVILASTLVGWLLAVLKVLPGATAVCLGWRSLTSSVNVVCRRAAGVVPAESRLQIACRGLNSVDGGARTRRMRLTCGVRNQPGDGHEHEDD